MPSLVEGDLTPPEPQGFLGHEGRWLGWTLALVGLAAVLIVVGLTLSKSVKLPFPGTRHTTATTATTVQSATAVAFDPLGDGTENDDQARNAVDRNPATAWRTQHYNSPALGGLKPGVGLILALPDPVAARELDLTLISPGGSVAVYGAAGNASPTTFPGGWTQLASDPRPAGRTDQLTLAGEGSYRWYLVWFTRLPPARDDPQRYQGGIAEAVLKA